MSPHASSGQGTASHQEVSLLLPWYVNGTLSERERDRVAAHVHHCAACRRETRFLSSLQAAVQEDQSDVAVDAGLERVWARIAERVPEVAHAAPPRRASRMASRAAVFMQALRAWAARLEGLRSSPGGMPLLPSFALLALFVVAWWLASPSGVLPPGEGDGPAMSVASSTRQGPMAPYRTLSAGKPAPQQPVQAHEQQLPVGKSPMVDVPAAGPSTEVGQAVSRIVVVFSDRTTAQSMQAMLREAGASVVNGPGPEGAYVISVDAGRRGEILKQWQGRPEVRFAQPADGTALDAP